MASSGKNRRRHPRVRARGLAAHVRTSDRSLSSEVEDISAGGLFLRTDQILSPGTVVTLWLVKPGWKRSLELPGRVVTARRVGLHSRSSGLGIAFALKNATNVVYIASRLNDGIVPGGFRQMMVTLRWDWEQPAPPRAAPEPELRSPERARTAQ